MTKTRLSNMMLAVLSPLAVYACGSVEESMSTSRVADPLKQHQHLAVGCGDHADEHEHPEDRKRAARKVFWASPHYKKSRTQDVRILGFNDFHGQLSTGRLVGGRPVGGAAVLASYLQAASDEVDGRALIVHAGDHVGASPPASALLQDEPSISFLNLIANRHCRRGRSTMTRCNVLGTLGNHEFDEGKDELLRLLRGGNHADGPFLEDPYRGARFEYVSANVVVEDTGRSLIVPYAVRQVGRVHVGLIGAVLEETPTIVTPTGVAGLQFQDEASAINRSVKMLRKLGVEAIGVVIHQGGRQTSYAGETDPSGAVDGPIVQIIQQLDDAVDFVVSGHAHSFTNALVPNADGKPVLVTQAFSASTAYGEIDLSIDLHSRDVVAKSAQIITTYSDVAPGNAPHSAVAALVKAAEDLTAPLVGKVIAESAVAITRAETPAGESAMGNLIADAQRAATGADIALMNPGGIRADLDAGPATWGELFTVQPFGNSLVTMDLTGQQIIDVLNQQWIGQAFPRILKGSGLSYVWDSTIPVGENRIVSASIGGTPLDLAAVYRVTVNSFMAAGGDNFTVLTSGTNLVGGDVDLDALINYVQSLPQPFSASVEARIGVQP